MSDELDRLTENEQVILDQQIQHARNSAADKLPFTGTCHYCKERIGEKKFCDEHCSQDWHEERAAKLRNHGAYRSAD
jgi:hypothetical protein